MTMTTYMKGFYYLQNAYKPTADTNHSFVHDLRFNHVYDPVELDDTTNFFPWDSLRMAVGIFGILHLRHEIQSDMFIAKYSYKFVYW